MRGRERALTPGGHLVDSAQVAGLEAGAGRLQRRVVALDVTDRPDQALGGERIGQLACGRGVHSQRLLDHGVHAGLGQGQADLLVVDRRDGNHAVVEADGDELLDAVHQRDAAGDSVLVTAGVGDGHEVNALEPAQDPSMVTAHHAQPDQAGSQVCHLRHLPLQGR